MQDTCTYALTTLHQAQQILLDNGAVGAYGGLRQTNLCQLSVAEKRGETLDGQEDFDGEEACHSHLVEHLSSRTYTARSVTICTHCPSAPMSNNKTHRPAPGHSCGHDQPGEQKGQYICIYLCLH